MKILTIIFCALISIQISFAQLPSDYPFKTYLDEQNNLYLTGYDNNDDIITRKFIDNTLRWEKAFINPLVLTKEWI